MTVRELGTLLRSGKASSVELVQEAFAQVREHDHFHTFITLTEEQALAEAIDRDKELVSGIDRGPMHGIPIAYKDLFFTRGIKTTAGSLLFRDHIPNHDAAVVERLRMGGAVSIGKTNLHELAYGATSKNPHYGFVLNPHDSARIAGGSSGGSAVAIAAGFIPVALGTDTGGSIRIPASYCGVAGFKPTYGLVSRRGVFPLAYSLDHAGPLGVTAEDCALVMGEIAGHDSADPASAALPKPDFYKGPLPDLTGVRAGVPKNYYFDHVSTDVAAAVHSALTAMQSAGARLVEIELPDITEMNATARIIQWSESAAVYTGRRDAKEFGPDVWALIEQGRLVKASDYVNAQRLRSVFRNKFDAVWSSVDLLVTPATPIVAPAADQDQVDIDGYAEDARMASTRMTRAVNLIGEPAISLPCGKSKAGMPIGLQLVAAPFRDAWLLRAAQTVEPLVR